MIALAAYGACSAEFGQDGDLDQIEQHQDSKDYHYDPAHNGENPCARSTQQVYDEPLAGTSVLVPPVKITGSNTENASHDKQD